MSWTAQMIAKDLIQYTYKEIGQVIVDGRHNTVETRLNNERKNYVRFENPIRHQSVLNIMNSVESTVDTRL